MRKYSGLVALGLGATMVVSATLAADFPAATYKAENAPFTVSFDGKGEFHVDQGQTTQVKGTYAITADQIKLTDVSGPWACSKGGEQTGTYHWKVDGGALMMSFVSDKCSDRVNSIVNRRWVRQ